MKMNARSLVAVVVLGLAIAVALALALPSNPTSRPDGGGVRFGAASPSTCTVTTPCAPVCFSDLCIPTYCVASACVQIPAGYFFSYTTVLEAGVTADYCSAISALASCGLDTCVYIYDPGPTAGTVNVFAYPNLDGAPPAPLAMSGCFSTTFATPFKHGRAFWCPSSLLEAGASCTN